jgi:succinate dehydrogenase / fumarate reductase cytochrome b subunit
VTLWLLAALAGDQAFALMQGFRASLIGQVMLFGWLFAFVYHFLNGIRHLKWDAGYGINMESVTRSGWVVVVGSLLLTILIWTSS